MATKDRQQHNSSFLRSTLVSLLAVYGVLLLMYWLLWLIVGDDINLLALLHNLAPYYFLPVIVGLPLALILHARRTFFLYGLLALIGFLWFGVLLLPKPNPVVQGQTVELITFNVYPENERLPDAIDWLLSRDADVIALQEIGGDISRLKQAYPHHVAQPYDHGHAIFSRYPVLDNNEFLLEETAHQRVRLDVNGQPVVLYNVHLYMPFREQSDRPLWLRYDPQRRNRQIRDLLQYASNENDPLIIAGDFNMSEFSPAYRTLNDRFTDSYRAITWGIGATWPGGNGEELQGNWPRLVRLDYVWLSDALQPVRALVGQPLGSDHLPVIVEIDVPASSD
jgi:endonuclease/exonuclease/phosphatase family metal-dependent hydrolase